MQEFACPPFFSQNLKAQSKQIFANDDCLMGICWFFDGLFKTFFPKMKQTKRCVQSNIP
jgi:hypothetical protein